VVESGGLENRCTRKGTVGSNPTLSASSLRIAECGFRICESRDSLPNSEFAIRNPQSAIWGEVQEWLNWQHWKCCVRETVPWVRIPPSPPERLRIADCELRILNSELGEMPSVRESPIRNSQFAVRNFYQAPEVVQSRDCESRQAGNGATVAVRGCAAATPEPDHFSCSRKNGGRYEAPRPDTTLLNRRLTIARPRKSA
jgi:hypothetical protein